MYTLHNDVFEAIAGITRLSTEVMRLDAIWLDKPLQTGRRLTRRILRGDMVRVAIDANGYYLTNCGDELPPTHLILECKGTIYSGDLQVICEDLDTQELITVKL